MANKFEATLERWVFRSRWLLAPFFIGLLLAIAALLIKFVQTFWVLALQMFTLSGNEMIIQILSLVDAALIGVVTVDHRLQRAMRISSRRSASATTRIARRGWARSDSPI